MMGGVKDRRGDWKGYGEGVWGGILSVKSSLFTSRALDALWEKKWKN